jgi:glutathionyl-hydroquinone reductase
MLEGHQYLVGDRFTFIDLRIFMCLIRFDPVYIVHFKCNKRPISSYKNISRYVRHLYHDIGLKETCDMDHIKRHYYGSHPNLNPKGFVPLGPDPWWETENQKENNYRNYFAIVSAIVIVSGIICLRQHRNNIK